MNASYVLPIQGIIFLRAKILRWYKALVKGNVGRYLMNDALQHVQDDEEDDEAGSLKDFIDDGSSDDNRSDSDIQEVDETGSEKRTTRANKVFRLIWH